MSRLAERKVLTGTTPTMWVLMPKPWAGLPTMSFRRAGVETAAVMTALRAADSITDITNPTTLVGAALAAGVGLAGPEWGLAFLTTAQNGNFPVQVERLTTTSVLLAEPLPVVPIITGALPASLVYRWYSVTVPAAVTGTETGTAPVSWRVTYTHDPGSAVGTNVEYFGGLAHVVNEIFDPGVGHADVSRYLGPDVIRDLPTEAQDWSGELEAAQRQLTAYIRAQIKSSTSGRREDDLHGASFFDAMLEWTASIILGRFDGEESERRMKLTKDHAETALRSVSWYDADGDGIGQIGEPGVTSAHFAGGSFQATSDRPCNPFDYHVGPGRGS